MEENINSWPCSRFRLGPFFLKLCEGQIFFSAFVLKKNAAHEIHFVLIEKTVMPIHLIKMRMTNQFPGLPNVL